MPKFYVEIDPETLVVGDEVQFDGEIFEIIGFSDDIVCMVCNGYREWVSTENIVFDTVLKVYGVRNRTL